MKKLRRFILVLFLISLLLYGGLVKAMIPEKLFVPNVYSQNIDLQNGLSNGLGLYIGASNSTSALDYSCSERTVFLSFEVRSDGDQIIMTNKNGLDGYSVRVLSGLKLEISNGIGGTWVSSDDFLEVGKNHIMTWEHSSAGSILYFDGVEYNLGLGDCNSSTSTYYFNADSGGGEILNGGIYLFAEMDSVSRMRAFEINQIMLDIRYDVMEGRIYNNFPFLDWTTDSGDFGDNITNYTRPIVNVSCREIGQSVDLFVDGVLYANKVCDEIWPVSFEFASDLVDGSYVITYVSTSSIGVVGEESPALDLEIDTVLPSVSISSIGNGDASLDQNEYANFTVNVLNDAGVDLYLKMVDSLGNEIEEIALNAGPNYQFLNLDVSSLVNGDIMFELYAIDVVGNQSIVDVASINKINVVVSSGGGGSSSSTSQIICSFNCDDEKKDEDEEFELNVQDDVIVKNREYLLESLGKENIDECLVLDKDRVLEFGDLAEIPQFINNLGRARIADKNKVYVVEGIGGELVLDGELTRAQAAKIIMMAHCLPIFEYKDLPGVDIFGEKIPVFLDLDSGTWEEDVMYSAAYYGLFAGYGDGLMKPKQNISGREFYVVLSRVFDVVNLESKAKSKSFKFMNWYQDRLNGLLSEGVLENLDDLDKSILRGQAFSMLNDALLIRNMYVTQ